MRSTPRPLVLATLALAALAALPVVAIVTRGVAPGAGATWSHLVATVLPEFVVNTIVLVVLVGIGTAFGGTITGWLVARRRFPGSRFFEWSLLLPLAMPAYVMAYAYTDLLDFAGPVQTTLREWFGWSRGDYWFPDIRSVPGAALMFVFTLYPYVYVLARNAFLDRPPALVEAARTLGLTRYQTFWRVELPLSRPAIAGGVALALMETLADYGTVAYFAVQTFTTGVYRAWFSLGDRAAAAQLACALLAFVVAAVMLERVARGAGATHAGSRIRQGRHVPSVHLTGWRAWGATVVSAIPLVVGFALPLTRLVQLGWSEEIAAWNPRFLDWAWNSVRVAAAGAAIIVTLSIVVAYAVRLAPGKLTTNSSRVLALGYAVPGTVLAVGVLLPLGALDNLVLSSALGARYTGPLLTGSVVALVYAYCVRYFAVSWNGIEPAFASITPAMDDAARVLRAGAWGTLVRVHAPLLAPSMAAASLLVFVDIMKELPATLVLRPFNFDTLATQTYLLAKDERLAEAALPSLAMVAVGLVPIVLLARMARRR